MEDYFSIRGKIAVITGGANGLGYEYAKALLIKKIDVIICDINRTEVELAEKNLSKYGSVKGYVVDISKEEDVIEWVNTIQSRHGFVDFLINNAGVVQRKTLIQIDGTEWNRIMDINVKGTFLCSRYFGQSMMKARKGKIINISSVAGRKAMDLRLAYCTSKAAIEHFTRTLAYEMGKYNVTVNAIAPGYIASRMNEDVRSDPQTYEEFVKAIPLQKFGVAEDLIGPMLFLISQASDYVTGQTIFVDGGVTTN